MTDTTKGGEMLNYLLTMPLEQVALDFIAAEIGIFLAGYVVWGWPWSR